MKYAFDRKFIEVYVYQKLSKQSLDWRIVMLIKRCSFVTNAHVVTSAFYWYQNRWRWPTSCGYVALSRNSVRLGDNYVKLIEVRPTHTVCDKNVAQRICRVVFSSMWLIVITENECVIKRIPPHIECEMWLLHNNLETVTATGFKFYSFWKMTLISAVLRVSWTIYHFYIMAVKIDCMLNCIASIANDMWALGYEPGR